MTLGNIRSNDPEMGELVAGASTDFPERVVIGRNGAYWRDYGDHYSSAIISTDNDPVVPIAVYVPANSWPNHEPGIWRGLCGHVWDRRDEDTEDCPRCAERLANNVRFRDLTRPVSPVPEDPRQRALNRIADALDRIADHQRP